jgi:hypothetical protein
MITYPPTRSLRLRPPPQGGRQRVAGPGSFTSPWTGEVGAQRREGVLYDGASWNKPETTSSQKARLKVVVCASCDLGLRAICSGESDMVGKSTNDDEPRWRRALRLGAFAIGLGAVAAGPILHLIRPDSHIGWSLMIAGLIFMVASRFDEVVEIGFGSFRTTLERRVKKVEDTMSAVRRLAKASARNALNSVQFAGRMGGFSETEKMQFLRDSRRLLSDLGVNDDEIAETETLWHKIVEFDYSIWALGRSTAPEGLSDVLNPEWKALRSGGIENIATPEKIRAFLTKAKILTPERAEILKDYEHYVMRRQHRREDTWLRHKL